MFTTEQAIQHLKRNRKSEFKNTANKNIEIFNCVDGTIGIGEIGDGRVKTFNPDNHKKDMWILSINPYKRR